MSQPAASRAPRSSAALRLPHLRWYNSIFFRLVALGGILMACMLALIVVITTVYINEAAAELASSAETASQQIALELLDHPDKGPEDLEKEIHQLVPGMKAEIATEPINNNDEVFPAPQKNETEKPSTSVVVEHNSTSRVAKARITIGGREMLLTLSVPIYTGTEVIRAFKNRYMIALTAVFLLTLGMMIYVFAHSLRPLTELSERCASITAGDLREVNTANSTGEVRALEETFNRMVLSLRDKEMMETKLREAQRLSALGNLAAGIAHDVRNPLNAIKLLSSHALDTLENGSDNVAAKPLMTIRKEVDRLEDIVSSFLSLARERELIPEPCEVDALLEECLHLFRREAESRGIRIVSELRAGKTELLLDPKHFTRAVLNVLMNALEACPPGGRVRLFSRTNDRQLEVEIRDDGPGMDKATQERIFEPYYTTKPGGTGLGLAITRGIIEEHGGTIGLTSTPGQGCQVLISFPLKQSASSIV